MYVLARINKEFHVGSRSHYETVSKIVSYGQERGLIEEKKDQRDREMVYDKEKFNTLMGVVHTKYRGSLKAFKEADPEGHKFILKFRDAGMENYVRHEIMHVGKW